MPRMINCIRCKNRTEHYARGLCALCYQTVLRAGGLEKYCAKGQRRGRTVRIVDCPGCSQPKKHLAKGLCGGCYYKSTSKRKQRRRRAARMLKGMIPGNLAIGHLHAHYGGGREIFCAICRAPAGYRLPCQIYKNKSGFRCRTHRGAYNKRVLSRECFCEICEQSVGLMPPHRMAKNQGRFRCPQHRYTITKETTNAVQPAMERVPA